MDLDLLALEAKLMREIQDLATKMQASVGQLALVQALLSQVRAAANPPPPQP